MSRIQLALNVSDVDAAVDFYSKLFGAEPAKRKPGYANFAIEQPPLKLVLIENANAAGPLNHLGVEVFSTDEVASTQRRLSGEGLATAGLTTAGPGGLRFHQDVQGLAGVPEPGDAFGASVAAVAVQTPDVDSLVVGVPGERVTRDRDGMVQQLSTFEFGPNPVGSRTLHQDTPGVRGGPAAGDLFGWAVR